MKQGLGSESSQGWVNNVPPAHTWRKIPFCLIPKVQRFSLAWSITVGFRQVTLYHFYLLRVWNANPFWGALHYSDEWLFYKHVVHTLSTEWPFYFWDFEAGCCMCTQQEWDLYLGKVPWGPLCVVSASCGAISLFMSVPGTISCTNKAVLKYMQFCPPKDILQRLKTFLCYWHTGMLLKIRQWTPQPPPEKNYLAQNVSSAQFEKLSPKRILDTHCLFVPLIKYW